MSDLCHNIGVPPRDEIVESTVETAHTAEIFGIDPRVTLLSYSARVPAKGREPSTRCATLPPAFRKNAELRSER